jgi:RND family efflux transporter MFP subunit
MSESPSPPPAAAPLPKLGRYGTGLAVAVVLLAVLGVASRVLDRTALARDTAAGAIPVVAVRKPDHSPAAEALTLPGSVQAFVEAPIYARTDGYLHAWYADIGTHVNKGELLAEIDTPEIDQQLSQANADLAMAVANAELARTTNERWKDLLKTNSVSQQDADSKAGDAAAKQAAADSARANVARLRELESFKRVVAPFDGVVTQRNTDIGALISAGQNSGTALFRVADTRRLRVYVQVPEPYARETTPGIEASVAFASQPGKAFPARVVRTASALDPALRTLQVELQLDNASGALLPGAYAEVTFMIHGSATTPRVPANALLFRSEGMQIAVVGADHHVRLHTIVPGRDFGRYLEVLSGIGPDDDIVVNPPDSLFDGAEVRLAPRGPERAAGAAGGTP